MNVAKLVTKTEQLSERIRERLAAIADEVTPDCIGMAAVVVRGDGSSYICHFGANSRLMLLGAVHDLTYSLAKDGDA